MVLRYIIVSIKVCSLMLFSSCSSRADEASDYENLLLLFLNEVIYNRGVNNSSNPIAGTSTKPMEIVVEELFGHDIVQQDRFEAATPTKIHENEVTSSKIDVSAIYYSQQQHFRPGHKHFYPVKYENGDVKDFSDEKLIDEIVDVIIGTDNREKQRSSLPANDSSKVIIQDHGIHSIRRNDQALIFYISVLNNYFYSVDASLSVYRCCLILSTPTKRACGTMMVMGGRMGDLPPKETHNLTAIWANLYLLDREGFCVFDIILHNEHAVRNIIVFNTTFPRQLINKLLPSSLTNLLGEVANCYGPDQDRLRECRAANCAVKYDGERNFYNLSVHQCQAVPRCTSSSTISDMVYFEAYNRCKPMKNKISIADVSIMSTVTEEAYLNFNKYAHVICEHGHPSSIGFGCQCDIGWTTTTLKQHLHDQYKRNNGLPTEFIMCNEREKTSKRQNLLITVITCLLIFISILSIMGLFVKLYLDRIANSDNDIRSRYNQNLLHELENEKILLQGMRKVAIAIVNYKPKTSDELALQEGNIITNIKGYDPPHVFLGISNDKLGFFFSQHVRFEIIEELSASDISNESRIL